LLLASILASSQKTPATEMEMPMTEHKLAVLKQSLALKVGIAWFEGEVPAMTVGLISSRKRNFGGPGEKLTGSYSIVSLVAFLAGSKLEPFATNRITRLLPLGALLR
jgi:hypothetical protein